jgi:hypothetical protein
MTLLWLLPFLIASSLVIHIMQGMPLSFSLSFFLFWFKSKANRKSKKKKKKRTIIKEKEMGI